MSQDTEAQEQVSPVGPDEYNAVMEVWEASVRATHHYLREKDLQFYKPLVRHKYLKAVKLHAVRHPDGSIAGFMGTAKGALEMLFIHPDSRGKGIGKLLLLHAIHKLKVSRVDVNEQNVQAIGFYERFGFRTADRSERDGTGKPYPILHMQLT
ncbi:GNAT family N-acetyltransferase [Pontibacter akesuensis]|uniref:Putative acetyltransferase n=1 Tax=Pontibacter akesuensis TaxID=388950 RepID=A0A1I7JE90_9BACT|nr:GNAT family N-acetyltransferase [Pontibacter akesuensis]GHA70573.1 hypothetical protein GCM10007389_24950 [Pontibacter akesuensis]SFU83478.1 putative acetyltransferase [Pontibacter akesuensis]